jgi:hypothetical protein
MIRAVGIIQDILETEGEIKEFFFLSHKYHFSDIIVSSWYKKGSTAGLCEAGLVLDEVDEHIGGAIQGGQQVGEVGQVLCTSYIYTIYTELRWSPKTTTPAHTRA